MRVIDYLQGYYYFYDSRGTFLNDSMLVPNANIYHFQREKNANMHSKNTWYGWFCVRAFAN